MRRGLSLEISTTIFATRAARSAFVKILTHGRGSLARSEDGTGVLRRVSCHRDSRAHKTDRKICSGIIQVADSGMKANYEMRRYSNEIVLSEPR